MEKPLATFNGDTFKNLVRAYSNERMGRDRNYRDSVHEAIAARRAEQAAKKAAEATKEV